MTLYLPCCKILLWCVNFRSRGMECMVLCDFYGMQYSSQNLSSGKQTFSGLGLCGVPFTFICSFIQWFETPQEVTDFRILDLLVKY